MFSLTASSCVASLATSGPTMGRSLWPRLFRSGSQRSEPRLPTSHQAAPERMVTSRASTHACEMNCSMVKYFTRCVRPKSSSKVGGATSTQSGRMNRWTTSHQHRKCSCPPSLRGRLLYVDRLRRPRWRNGQLSTNIPPGPLDGGRSMLYPLVLPMFFPEFTRIGNDCLCLFLVGVTAFLLSKWLKDENNKRLSVAIGVVLGLGLLTKAFFIP